MIDEVELQENILGELVYLRQRNKDLEAENISLKTLAPQLAEATRFFDLSLDILLVSNISGNILKTNAAFNRLLGYAEEEYLNKKIFNFCKIEDTQPFLVKESNKIAVPEEPIEFIARFSCKDGSYKWLQWNVNFDSMSSLAYWVGRDITEKKGREQEVLFGYDYLNSMLESMTDAFLALDNQWQFTYCNTEAEKFIGKKRTELIGKGFWDVFSAMIGTEFWEQLQLAMYQRATVHFELLNAPYSGRCYEFHVYPLNLGIAVYYREITEKIEANNNLRLSEERFSKVFNLSPDMMLLIDYDTLHVVDVNQSFLKSTGLSKTEVVDQAYTELKHAVISKERHQMIEIIKSEGFVENYEVEFWQANKKVGINLVSAKIINTDKKKFILIVANNITEKKKMERLILTSESRFRNAFNYSSIGMALVGLNGDILQANPSLCKILGYTEPELQLLSFPEFTHPEDLEQDLIKFQKMVSGEINNYQMEKRYLRKDGHEIWGLLSLTSARGNLETPIHFVAQVQDITERKRLEKEMLRLDRLDTIGQMAAGIGHEIRNPMTSVRGFLQLLQRKEEFKSSHEIFQLMIDELDRANGIISEFLSLARNKEVQLKAQNLNDIIRSLSPLMFADAIKDDKYIKFEIRNVPLLLLDEKQIRQLILNLVRNGLEAIDSSGRITIRTYAEKEEVVMAIVDQGKGIDATTQKSLGTPFFTTKDNGTGLGLAICYSIAARHNASIDFETSERGTTFFLRFKNQHIEQRL